MYVVLAQHYAQLDKIPEAQDGILRFGLALRSFNGFIGRHTVIDIKEPSKILSITLWRNKNCYDKWQNSETRIGFTERHSYLWTHATERTAYESIDEL